jgi:hypothetical protein
MTIYASDVGLNFFVAFYDDDGELVTDLSSIASKQRLPAARFCSIWTCGHINRSAKSWPMAVAVHAEVSFFACLWLDLTPA